jgi:hypothetical protein
MFIYDLNNNINGMKIICNDCYNLIFVQLSNDMIYEKIETNKSLYLSEKTYLIQNNSIKCFDKNIEIDIQ